MILFDWKFMSRILCNYNSFLDLENEIKKSLWKKICILLMSGWVDSSTCLVLLQKEWYHVIWLHYDFWSTYKTNLENKCCNLSDLKDAYEICKKFWVKLYNIDYKEKFKNIIINVFLEKKSKWEHFNPCSLCHEKIKYWEIIDLVKKYNIFLASWYYCKIKNQKLMVPKDKSKDQTQSLILKIKQEDLKYYVFPLWNYLKSEVRDIAEKSWIKVFNKKDSMWLCFVWEKNIKDFILNYCELKSWDIYFFDWKNKSKIWKKHKWLWLYEIWENSWFNKTIDLKVEPLFVYEKNILANILILSEKNLTLKKWFISSEFNLFSENFENVSIRYNSNLPLLEWKVKLQNWKLEIIFNNFIEWIVLWEIFLISRWEELIWGGIIDTIS